MIARSANEGCRIKHRIAPALARGAAALAPLLFPSTARAQSADAANNECAKQAGFNNYLYTCSGNQSAGIAFNISNPPSGATIVPSDATGINITNLTSNITAPVAINVVQSYKGSFPVTFSDP